MLFLALWTKSSAQMPNTGFCTKKPTIQVHATVSNFDFKRKIYIHKDSLRNGFTLELSDDSFTIEGFRVYFYGKDADLYWRDIPGASANLSNLPILNKLHGDEWMEIDCISVQKNKKQFKGIPFTIWINSK